MPSKHKGGVRMVSISAVEDPNLICSESLVAAVAKSWGIDYRLMFFRMWSFRYTSAPVGNGTAETLGARLQHSGCDFTDVEKKLGIRVTHHVSHTPLEALAIIRSELNDMRPVGLNIDAFWCPWHPLFGKQHLLHTLGVVDIRETSGDISLKVMDSLFPNQLQSLPLSALEKDRIECLRFAPLPTNAAERGWEELLGEMIKKAEYEDGGSVMERIREFANEVRQLSDILREIEGYPYVDAAPLFTELNMVALMRNKLSDALGYVWECSGKGEMRMFAAEFKRIAKQWEVVQHLLLKSVFLADASKVLQLAAKKMEEIADAEERVLHGLKKEIEAKNAGADSW